MRQPLRRTLQPALGALCAATAVCALSPTLAPAATVTRDGAGTIVYTAAPGEVNRVGVQGSDDGATFTLYDNFGQAGADVPAECRREDWYGAVTVQCPVTAAGVRVELGDGDDQGYVSTGVTTPVTQLGGDGSDELQGNEVANALDGGAGDDRLLPYQGDDVVSGGDGRDVLEGGQGSDRLDGGPGDDLLSGDGHYDELGRDVIDGGAGFDRIESDWHSHYSAPLAVAVTLGGGADDGRPGEGDDVRGVEQLDLSLPATVTGTDAAERIEFHQLTNPVRIEAGGGDDVVQGGEGNDVVNGGAGNDDVDGSFGDDTIDPGPGRDTVSADLRGGDCGPLWCKSPYGNDTVLARDGEVDSISCGAGTDRVVADAADVVAPDCETVERAGGSGPAPGPGRRAQPGIDPARPQPRPGARAVLKATAAVKLRTALARGVAVRVSGAAAGARLALTARAGKRVVASGRARAGRNGGATVTLRFTRAARRSLKRATRVTLTISGAGAALTLPLKR
ncbi:MAG TPA: calcium-binding protein [Conexibacter sp.]|nr:calcium-binding protein [Conexibacter sp.]